jgi:hypothetical protein
VRIHELSNPSFHPITSVTLIEKITYRILVDLHNNERKSPRNFPKHASREMAPAC